MAVFEIIFLHPSALLYFIFEARQPEMNDTLHNWRIRFIFLNKIFCFNKIKLIYREEKG